MKLLSKHNLFVGTNAERLASFATPPHEGADYLETDTGNTYTFVYGDWEPVGGGGGATTFLGLTDTPGSYAGAAGQMVVVNPGETGLAFTATVPAHDIVGASHNVAGSQWDVVGLTAVNTLGLLTPSSDTSAGSEALLKSSANGRLGIARLGIGAAPSLYNGINVSYAWTGVEAVNPAGVLVDLTLFPSTPVGYSAAYGINNLITWNSTGSLAALYGANFTVVKTTGTITDAVVLRLNTITNSSGTITTGYGLKIEDQDEASTNYAIHTGAGLNSLGDNLQFRQAAAIATAAGALTLEPAAGSDLNINLSTTGDFIVNTSRLVVDTSTGRVGIGTAVPGYQLHVGGDGYISGRVGFGAAPSSSYTANIYRAVTSDAGADYGVLARLEYTGGVSYTGSLIGYEGRAANNVAQTVTTAIGIIPAVYNSHASGSMTNARALQTSIFNNGSIATTTQLYVSNWSGAGTVTGTNYGVFVVGQTGGAANYSIYTNAGDVRLMASATDKIGFHGSAPVAKQTVTGSRGGNAALADLLTKLATLGLIVNSTSA